MVRTKPDSRASAFTRGASVFRLSTMMAGIRKPLAVLILAGLAIITTSCTGGEPIHLPLTELGNIQLPREPGSNTPVFDLLTLDTRRGLLYVAHESASTIEIVDVRASRVVGRVPGIPGVKQVAITPDPNIIFASASGD